MHELKQAFEHVWRDLARRGYIEDDPHMMQAAWWQFITDLQRNVYPSKGVQ